jgi:hypothetical protein
MKRACAISITIVLMFFSGCETGPISQNFLVAPLEGKIFDYDNTPCSEVQIFIDKNSVTSSDINGRFVIPNLTKGNHELRATKDGYEEIIINFGFSNKNQVLWLRMISVNQLVKQIENAIDDRKMDEAENLIDRALKVSKDDPVVLYLQALYFIQNGWIEQSIEVLTKIVESGHPEPAVLLTLADLYQFRLNNRDAAIMYLERYLDVKTDENIFKRLEAIKKSK